MGGKLFLALQLEVAHHFIERCAGERTRRSEPPATYGATKTPKMLLLNPYQLPAHGRLCRCTPTSTRLLSGDETFWFAINGSFRSGVLPDCSRKPYPVWACRKMHKKMHKKMGEVYMRQFWMVCRTSYIHGKVLFVRTADFGGLVGSERNRFKWWSRFVRLEAVSIAQYQEVVSSIVLPGLREVGHHARPDFHNAAYPWAAHPAKFNQNSPLSPSRGVLLKWPTVSGGPRTCRKKSNLSFAGSSLTWEATIFCGHSTKFVTGISTKS